MRGLSQFRSVDSKPHFAAVELDESQIWGSTPPNGPMIKLAILAIGGVSLPLIRRLDQTLIEGA